MMPPVTCPYCNAICTSYWAETAVWHCPDCDLLFRHPQPNTQSLDAYYASGWQNPEQQIISGATDAALAEVYVERLRHLLPYSPFKQSNLLEFGAGTGAMVNAIRNAGATVTAIEPFGHDYLQEKGITVYPHLSALPEMQFDGIYSIQVLEHLPKPWETLHCLCSYLKPGGWLYISTIHGKSLHARISGGKWREAQNPGHLYFFTPANLVRLLTDAGYGRIQRVTAFIRYPNRHRWQSGQDYLLQRLGLSGELCYWARNPE